MFVATWPGGNAEALRFFFCMHEIEIFSGKMELSDFRLSAQVLAA